MNHALLTFKENIVLLLTSFRFIKSCTVLENFHSYIQSYILDSSTSTTTKTRFHFNLGHFRRFTTLLFKLAGIPFLALVFLRIFHSD